MLKVVVLAARASPSSIWELEVCLTFFRRVQIEVICSQGIRIFWNLNSWDLFLSLVDLNIKSMVRLSLVKLDYWYLIVDWNIEINQRLVLVGLFYALWDVERVGKDVKVALSLNLVWAILIFLKSAGANRLDFDRLNVEVSFLLFNLLLSRWFNLSDWARFNLSNWSLVDMRNWGFNLFFLLNDWLN